ncbi:latrophilin receptor-like protein A [Centruroides sculpturatus]|uniref:latrophilin receptor-like protein A n=1 Tax=Centruroides sculpturatus TaxID=218467 RepID=UPI000C6E1CF5|nr:latrophilin receptor-like protein A [Centruroides sculpturatus]XP_023242320.1 latrophilin receptor-like protein A [Centruroides sculpturatus]
MRGIQMISLLLFAILTKVMTIALTHEELTGNSTENIVNLTYNNMKNHTEEFGNFSQQFLSCPHIFIESKYFQILDNETLYVPNYSTYSHRGLYPPGDYYISGDGVYVCFLQVFIEEHKKVYYLEEILVYTTVIGLSMSLVCLFLHFVSFLLVPEMKNLPGKNLASLSLSLFMSNLVFLIGRIGYSYTWTCYPLGLANYYFMMSSFFWINSISFNVFRSFRQATTKLRLSKHNNVKRFFFYSLYSWGLPFVFLIVVVVGDETDAYPEYLKPGFKSRNCWFRETLSAIFFFAIPFGILVFINAMLFLFSAFIISSSFGTGNEENGKRKKFSLYLKLAVIMGLGWIFGLITYFVSSIFIKFISVIIISFQGVFIFLAFTRFHKTKARLLRICKMIVTCSTLHTEDQRSSAKKSSISTINSIASYRIKSEEYKPQNE